MQKIPHGESPRLPEVSKIGHAFIGWFTARDGGVKVTEDTIIQKDLICYAHWSPNVYTIAYCSNGGEGLMEDQAMLYNLKSVSL